MSAEMGGDGTTMAVCRKSSDATNVRWGPYAPDQDPDRDSSLGYLIASGIFVASYRAVPVALLGKRDWPFPQGRRTNCQHFRSGLRTASNSLRIDNPRICLSGNELCELHGSSTKGRRPGCYVRVRHRYSRQLRCSSQTGASEAAPRGSPRHGWRTQADMFRGPMSYR